MVNCVAPHPSLPIVAVAGIDSSIKVTLAPTLPLPLPLPVPVPLPLHLHLPLALAP